MYVDHQDQAEYTKSVEVRQSPLDGVVQFVTLRTQPMAGVRALEYIIDRVGHSEWQKRERVKES